MFYVGFHSSQILKACVSVMQGVPVAKEAESIDKSTTTAVSAPSETVRKRKCEQDEGRPTVQQKAKKRKIKTVSKRASSKKAKPVKKATTVQHRVQEGGLLEGSTTVGLKGTAKINPHRAKILVGKQALAAIKEGTSEIYMRKSIFVLAAMCCFEPID